MPTNDNNFDVFFIDYLGKLTISDKAKTIFVTFLKDGTQSECCFYAFVKNNNAWEQLFFTEGYLGRNGVVEPEQRYEGSGMTPLGVYSFGMLFGLCDKPDGLKRKYKKIDSDDYWDGDCNSDTYNQYVKASQMPPEWDKGASEHLIDFCPAYNYAAMINYNVEPAVKGKGSAIFFHCTRPGCDGSAGCVCIPEEHALSVLRLIDDEAFVIILREPTEIKKYIK